MNVVRNEIRTGLLATVTLAILAAALLYLGAPAVLRSTHTYYVYFEDANGIQPGAAVNLAGRRVGQVRRIESPVPASERPEPKMQVVIEVEVGQDVPIYREQRVRMVQYSLLADQMIDFIDGKEESGRAPNGMKFVGVTEAGVTDAIPQLMEKLDPLLAKVTTLVEELQKTARQLTVLTEEGSDLVEGIANIRFMAENLNEITGKESPVRKAFVNLERLTSDSGALNSAVSSMDRFATRLSDNPDLDASLRNLRQVTAQMKSTLACLDQTMRSIAPELDATARNAKDFTNTVKRQPWRLIWPSTKKYPEDELAKQLAKQQVVTEEREYAVVAEGEVCPPPSQPKTNRRKLWSTPEKRLKNPDR